MVNRVATAPYAERVALQHGGFDRAILSAYGKAEAALGRSNVMWRRARAITGLAKAAALKSDSAILAEAGSLRPLLLHDRSAAIEERAFALVYAAVERHLGLRYHPVQLVGGLALRGRRVVEMATGEGKTITAALPAALAALAGSPTHVVTVNDYLAERDSERLRPMFAALGLTVGLVIQGQEPDERRQAYAADITYVTNKELAFDYLRDRIATNHARGSARQALTSMLGDASTGRGPLILRGLHVAVVDEVDSILIDEARTPLIISAEREDAGMADTMGIALDLARKLSAGEHYLVSQTERSVVLTEKGVEKLAAFGDGLAGVFRAPQARQQLMLQALSALHLFERDRHYILTEEGVQIVDEHTGRTMPDRTWQAGLHQLVEAKEGVSLTATRETLARITYQRFFNRYLRLSGMTGTAREVAGELRAVYGLGVLRLPTNRKPRRRNLGTMVAADAATKWARVAERVDAVARTGRPVLVGTQSVAASEALSGLLTARGVAHATLNARQDAAEAELVARAGQAGQVTVATNMAGRGTDIELGTGVREAGGLHVILTGFHDSTRVDRQLFGRAGRQGDPGSCEAIVALDDELFVRFAPGMATTLGPAIGTGGALSRITAWMLRRHAQTVASRLNTEIRRQQLVDDERLDKGLSFAGRE